MSQVNGTLIKFKSKNSCLTQKYIYYRTSEILSSMPPVKWYGRKYFMTQHLIYKKNYYSEIDIDRRVLRNIMRKYA